MARTPMIVVGINIEDPPPFLDMLDSFVLSFHVVPEDEKSNTERVGYIVRSPSHVVRCSQCLVGVCQPH